MGNRFFVSLFLLLSAALPAQEETKNSYYIDHSSGTIRFVQRLSWYPEEYVSRYEVRVELLSGESYGEILRESTQAEYLELSLPPGIYRYSVQSYDLLEKPAGNPPWVRLEVLPALSPELFSLEPQAVYAGKKVSLSLKGRSLERGARVKLRNRVNGREEDGAFIAEPGGDAGQAVFPSAAAGTYDVIVENPGGLSTSLGPLRVVPPQLDMYLSAGYEPLVPLHGQLNEILESKFYPLGFYARFGINPFAAGSFAFGAETAAGWNYLASDYSPGAVNHKVTGHLADIKLHLVIQIKPGNGPLAVKLYGGGGLAAILDFKKQVQGVNAQTVNVLFPAVSAGLSLRWEFSKVFFAELSAEYLYLFSADQSNPAYLLPSAGIGIKL
jgi:hypothetical protein